MLRLDDPTDNNGLGWRQMTREELEHNLCIWLLVMDRWKALLLKDRIAEKSHRGAKLVAEELAERLKNYPIFRPAKVPPGHTCGAGGINPQKR